MRVLDSDRARVAADFHDLATVVGVQVLAVCSALSGVKDERAPLIVGEHRLDVRRLVLPFDEGEVDQRDVDDARHDLADEGKRDTDVDKEVDLEEDTPGEIDDVQQATGCVVSGVIPHRDEFGDADLAVALAVDLDVVEVKTCLEADDAAEPGLDDHERQGRLEPELGPERELVLLLAARDPEVRDEEPVERLPRVAGLDRPADAERVVAEAEVGGHREAADHVDVDDRRPRGDRRDSLAEVEPEAQERHLVREERRVAAGQKLRPVPDVRDVLDDLEARAVLAREPAADA